MKSRNKQNYKLAGALAKYISTTLATPSFKKQRLCAIEILVRLTLQLNETTNIIKAGRLYNE